MNLPLDFQHLMINDLGKEEFDQLAKALSLPAPTSVRINTDKAKKEELPILDNAESVPWCKNGYYLPELCIIPEHDCFRKCRICIKASKR